MSSIVGFSLWSNLPVEKQKSAQAARERALRHFKHLEQMTVIVGESTLEIWGHQEILKRVHRLSDGSTMALIGSPLGKVSWQDIEQTMISYESTAQFEPPWDGRFVFIHLSADGKHWTMWNDWIGSIPIFHTENKRWRVASTVEPVTVAAAGFTPEDFFMPGLLSMFINGHYLADWTLYKEMKIVPADCRSRWSEDGFHANCLWTVKPSQDRWETGWDDLVDEMHELTHRAVSQVLASQPSWIVPLSSGLDSRLIAGVAADVGANVHTYAWGASDTTDVIYSRQIAKTLGFPWKHIELPKDYLPAYTPNWADLFGSSMHFHGMYQMAFLEQISGEPASQILTGYLGEDLSGDAVVDLATLHKEPGKYHLNPDVFLHWYAEEIKHAFKMPLSDALGEVAAQITREIESFPGAWYQRLTFLELRNRQRLFTYFQSLLSDYSRGVATPFLNRAYGRFCLSLSRAVLDHRHLLGYVFRRYYGTLAVIPGTYAKDPFILTGKYLIKRRMASVLPSSLHIGSLKAFANRPLRMDVDSIQACGKDALWPLFDKNDRLSNWLDLDQLEQAYQALMRSKEDIRPLRKLQSAQTLAYRLLSN